MPPDPLVPSPTAAVNPHRSSLAELAASDVSGPIAMLNLLRFDGEAGRVTYGHYAQVAAKTIDSVGGALMYLGRVVESVAWDSVALVYYPNCEAFLSMQNDQRYIEALPDRTAGLSARLLCPFALPRIDRVEAVDLIRNLGPGNVEAQLVQWNAPDSILEKTGDPESSSPPGSLRLQSIGSGLVTDTRWDELRLGTHAPGEGSRSDLESALRLDPHVADLLVVLSEPVGRR